MGRREARRVAAMRLRHIRAEYNRAMEQAREQPPDIQEQTRATLTALFGASMAALERRLAKR